MEALLCLLFTALLAAAGWAFWTGLHRVPSGHVGLVYRRLGQHPNDRWKIKVHGSAGWQARVLEPDTTHWLLPFLFELEHAPLTHVPDGTIGLVIARAGVVRPRGRRLGGHVDCDYFQDGVAFLQGGGEQGRQLDTLPGGGHYSINAKLFDVITVDTISTMEPAEVGEITAGRLQAVQVLEGHTGVVIVLEGAESSLDEGATAPIVPGHRNFREPWVFLNNGGQRGVQAETLSSGEYDINPWFARVVLVPTRDLHLEWTKKSTKSAGDLDSALDQIIVDIEGHRLSLEMSQVLRIPPAAAPRLIRRFGEEGRRIEHGGSIVINPAPIQRFVERVLGATVAGYFTELVTRYTILQFIEEYDEVRLELQERVTQALRDWGVIAGQTVLAEFESQDRSINELRRQIAAAREQGRVLEHERLNALKQADTDRTRIAVDADRQVAELRRQIELLGPRQVAIERIVSRMKDMNVPQVVGGGSGDVATAILSLMPLASAQEMLRALLQESGPALEPDQRNSPPRIGAEEEAVATAIEHDVQPETRQANG